MAAVDLGGGRPQKKKGGLKRPKRRVNVRNDLTPMVDIAFLLLIFYMVTTVFSTPLSMEISLPPKQTEVTEAKKIGESKLLQMFVDKNDSLYYQIGEGMKQPEQVSFKQLSEIIDDKNRNVTDLVMLLKIDHKASYQLMVVIIDEIQNVERQINMALDAAREVDPSTLEKYSVRFSLQDMNAWDEHVLEVVSQGGVVEE